MKRITKKSIGVYITFAILIVFLTGAQCSVGGCSVTFNDYTAKAVNVKAAESSTYFYKDGSDGISLEGAVVSLYAYDPTDGSYSDDPYDTVTVSSDGTFTFFAPISNRYKLTGTSSGWIFVPQYIEITNNGSAVKDLLAYPKEGAGVYTIVASWETKDMDVDLLLTYGDEAGTNVESWNNNTIAPNGTRYKIGYASPGSSQGISHDRDVDGSDVNIPNVETISIHIGASNWLETDDTIKIYLDTAPSTGDTLTGLENTAPSAFAQVDVVEYNSLTGNSAHFGTWYIPWNTQEKTLQVIQAVMTSNGLDIKSANNAVSLNGTDSVDYPTGIRSISWE